MLPDFLIVGAMKAGTTTLYRDLCVHPDVFLPAQKEPEVLTQLSDIEAIRREYASLFRPASAGQVKGEASTGYTKRPTHEGIAARARRACGADLKIVYMTRDPVDRVISHYLHDVQFGLIGEPLEVALDRHPELIDYSRYDWQIEPWIEAFGPAQVLRIELERYSRERRATVLEVAAFIGADPGALPEFDEARVYNTRSDQKHIANELLRRIIYSRLYARTVKRFVPQDIRDWGKRLLSRTETGEDTDFQDHVRDTIRSRLDARDRVGA